MTEKSSSSTRAPRTGRKSDSAATPSAGPVTGAVHALSGRAGFTLLELLLVLVVIALAGILVFPDLDPALRRVKTDAALKRTVSFLDDTRRRSVASGKILIITLEGEDERSVIVREEGETEETVAELTAEGSAEYLDLEPSEGRYYPQGHSSGFRLTVGMGGEEQVGIEVGSFTGLARILDGDHHP